MKTRHLIIWLGCLLLALQPVLAENKFYIPETTKCPIGETTEVSVWLDNTDAIVGLQFELSLEYEAGPSGSTPNLTDMNLTSRGSGHILTLNPSSGSRVKGIIYSASNNSFTGNSGALLRFKLKIPESTDLVGQKLNAAFTKISLSKGSQSAPVRLPDLTCPIEIVENKRPNFAVENIQFTSTTDIQPGGEVAVSWQVKNAGNAPTEAGWKESLFLTDGDGTDIYLGEYHNEDILSAGNSKLRTATVKLNDYPGIDGNVYAKVILAPYAGSGELESDKKDNEGKSSQTVAVAKKLTLNISKKTIAENSNSPIQCYLYRSGKRTSAESFSLEGQYQTDTERLKLSTASLTIPAGQSGAMFTIEAVDNNQANMDSTAVVIAKGNGYSEAKETIRIEDDERPYICVSLNKKEVTEGEEVVLTVTREWNAEWPLTVKISSDHLARFESMSSEVKIPENQTSVTVNLKIKDDQIPAKDDLVLFSASAPGHYLDLNAGDYGMDRQLLVKDNDVPKIKLSVAPSEVSESAGSQAAIATIEREGDTDNKITIKLTDNGNGKIYYPSSSITLERGEAKKQFIIGVVDNHEIESDQTVELTAAVYISSCNCSVDGTSTGWVKSNLTIRDDDNEKSISVSTSTSTLLEGKTGGILTVKINSKEHSGVSVKLKSDCADVQFGEPLTKAEAEKTILIPAGQDEVKIPVSIQGNTQSEGNRIATITIDAGQYGKSSCWVNVTDQNLPDAVITNISTETEVMAKGQAKVRGTVRNSGGAALSAKAKISLYLSTQNKLNDTSVLLGTMYTQKELEVEEEETVEENFLFPDVIGPHYLIAVVNEEQTKKELSFVNNTSSPLKLTLTPLYIAHISTVSKAILKSGESVVIKGKIAGKSVAHEPVELYLINEGYRQVFSLKTDASGLFEKEFKPESWQMGHFAVGACYPGEGLNDEMAAFDVHGLKRVDSSPVKCEALLGKPTRVSFRINSPVSPASNIKVKVLEKPQGCEVVANGISSLSARGTNEIVLQVTGSAVSTGADWEKIKLQLTSDEGAVSDVNVYYYCKPEKATLVSNVDIIKTTMARGSMREYRFMIANSGQGETGEIQVVVPKLDWLSLGTPSTMPSLKQGENATVVLRLSPKEGMQLTPVLGTIGINCKNGDGIPLNFNITPVSDKTGTLVIDVCDENTYYTQEAPHLAGASVRVTDYNTGELKGEGVTGADGLFTLQSLPEGYYTIETTAPDHDVRRKVILLEPGIENKVVINLSLQAISIDFTVEETTMDDKYSFTTTIEYETHVPVPAVVMTVPDRIYAETLGIGESLVYTVTLKNEGLITAKDCEFLPPEDRDAFSFEPMVTGPFDLKAQQSVTIPVKMTRKTNSKTRSSEGEVTPLPYSNCYMYDGTSYFWDCGEDKKWHKYHIPTKILECPDEGSGLKGFPLSGGGTIGPRDGKDRDVEPATGPSDDLNKVKDVTIPPVPVSDKEEGCIPCQVGYATAGLKCASHFVPGVDEVQVAVDEAIDSIEEQLIEEGLKNVGLKDDLIKKLFNGKDFLSFLGEVKEATSDCVKEFTDPERPELYKQVLNCYKNFEDAFDTFIDDYMDKYLNGKTPDQKKRFKAVAKRVFKVLGTVADILNCVHDFAHACDHLEQETKSGTNGNVPAYIKDFKEVADKAEEGLQSYMNILQEILGDSKEWNECSIEELIDCLNQFDMNSQAVYEKVVVYKPACIGEQTFRDFVERWNNTQAGRTGNVIDLQKVKGCSENMQKCDAYAKEKGAACIEQYFAEQYVLLMSKLDESSNAVCSSVSLQFNQTMALTRQAFKGTLTVKNGHVSTGMENVKLDLVVSDNDGLVATSHEFQINFEKLEGFEGDLAEEWTLAAQKTGTATIMFIPTKYAAPTDPKEYTFGGTLSYKDPFTGLEVTRDLYPVTMTVKPSPNLEMDYFMQRDILGDDPLTKDVVEPMIPSEFSLLIHNIGKGAATNVRMNTQQPKITDNEKGLLVDFQIKTSQLNGEEETAVMGESVLTDFGTIEAGKTAYAQWWLTSSLLGHFTDYKVEATHLTSYDNPDLSLLDTVRIHELIRGIRVNESSTPKVTGFMVNDIPDAEDFPDMMYLTNGTVAPVVKATKAELTSSGLNYILKVTPSAIGWNYISIKEPAEGNMELVSVNGDSNLDTRKVWQTDRTLRDGKEPTYEHLIHVVDYFDKVQTKTTGSAVGEFELVFKERPETVLAVESIAGLPEGNDVAKAPVGKITIKFNKGVSEGSLTGERVSVFCQGKKLDTEGLQFVQQEGNSYTLDLSALTGQNGVYTLIVHTSEIKDAENITGGEDYSVVWNQLAGGKVSLTAVADPEKAGTVTPAAAEVDYGMGTEFKATAKSGYLFKSWTIEDRVVSTAETYLHTAIVDQTLVANFDPIPYKIEITYDAAQGFVSFGTGYYEYDSSLELIATPNDGYRFVGWFIAGNLVSSKELFVYRVSGDAKLEARFQSLNGSTDPDDPNNPDDPDNPDDPTANENMETLVIQVYPTRVTDYVHVGVLPAKSRLILFNLAGKQVKQMASCEGNIDLFMGDQPSGFYLLYIFAGEERRQTVKLIKK